MRTEELAWLDDTGRAYVTGRSLTTDEAFRARSVGKLKAHVELVRLAECPLEAP